MKTDALITAIATDGATRPPSLPLRMTLALAIGGLAAAALYAIDLGTRPDMGQALQTWRFPSKLGMVLVACGAALWATVRLARPDARPRKVVRALALPAVLLAVAVGLELAVSPADAWVARAIGSNAVLCLTSIPLLALVPLIALLVALRAGAPASPAITGATAGLLAGALAATLYALHCFDDSPLFVALWYVPAVAAVALAGGIVGRRVLRW
jgi:hypothetical protein